MTDIKKTPIPQRLKNVSNDHPYVAGAIDIIDDVTGDNQQAINADTYRKRETYSQSEVNNRDSALQVDIDNVDEDLQATKAILNGKVMEIGDTVYDTQPTLNSAAPVTSDGLYRKSVQAEVVIGDPVGDWSPSSAEEAYEETQRQVTILEGIVNAAQLEIGAVETDLEPTEDSVNMLPSGVIFDYCALAGSKVGEV